MSLQVNIQKKLKGFFLNSSFETSNGCLGILGASGCGKSMTLKCIAGIETPDNGKIVLNERVLFDSENNINLTPQERKVGYLFQDYALFPNMNVVKNIGTGLRLPKGAKKTRVDEVIKFFHLDGLEDNYPHQLSGGQQQRVALARIMAYEPDVLMLDEPFSALDTYLKEQLQIQVQRVLRSYHGDVLLVTHNRNEVYRFCNEVLVMEAGSIVGMGETKEVFKNPDNITSAKLSGCKNISKAEKISEYRVLASDWGLTFQTAVPIKEDICYLGIRAHSFRPADKADGHGVNVFPCKPVEVFEGPFDLDIIVSCNNDWDIIAENRIWWKIGKEEWGVRLKEKAPQYLKVAAGDIMLLRK